MHYMEGDEEGPKSWVSIKSLREAAEVKSVYRGSSRTSPVHSPESSVSHEPRPMSVYQTAGKSMHEKPQSGSHSFDCGTGSAARVDELTRRRVSALDGDSGRLVDVVRMLHKQLTHDKAEIKGLKKEIAAMQFEFAQQKQQQQSRWQKKLAHSEALRLEATQNFEAEKARLRDEYEEMIETLKADHEIELQEKEEEWEAVKQKLMTAPPPPPQPRLQDIEEKHRRALEALEKRHLDEITKLRASLPEKPLNPANFRKQPALVKTVEAAVSPTSETAEIESLKLANKELKRLLEEERQRYSELQTQVQSAFRKKPQRSLAQTIDPSEISHHREALEGEIKSLLGQINTHLEHSDLFNSSYSLADSLRGICLKIDQMSASGFVQL